MHGWEPAERADHSQPTAASLAAGSIAYRTVDLTGVVTTIGTRPTWFSTYGFTSEVSGTSHQNQLLVGASPTTSVHNVPA